ncbi:TetR family transcriptional regulator [Streptomyces longisporoflavus]|uniref:TetR/AcrR family transcriptional regulator n=1 Tax=Streptomyces longisporoflavus TaxID=28044 RepID=UPI00167EB943|nr:TetR/AcrR family transcriptional regulator C-terminal domain-containing protein [Streptomyces longisporoflavus]GGV72784.1 TetR family transcriptional regulator [Streptomyces longisporoflavus]
MARDTLTQDQIVRTAVELLDAEGLAGLNMRALGTRLDSATTAVYWHVKSKDNLVLLATDQVWNELTLPDPGAADWRAAITAMATDLHAMFARHPWLVQVLAAHLVYGEGKARHDECSLALYEAAGFTAAQCDQAAGAVFTYVLGNATGAAATASLTRRGSPGESSTEEQFRHAMAEAREIAVRYPRLRARLETRAAADYAAAPEGTFEFGLRVLLDGLEQELAAQTGPTAPR